MKELKIVEYIEDNMWVWDQGKLYLPEVIKLWLHMIQEYEDAFLVGHSEPEKKLNLLEQQYYQNEMCNQVDQ